MVPQRCEDAPDSPYPSLWGESRVVGLEKGRKTQGPCGRGSVGKDGAPEMSVEEVGLGPGLREAGQENGHF